MLQGCNPWHIQGKVLAKHWHTGAECAGRICTLFKQLHARDEYKGTGIEPGPVHIDCGEARWHHLGWGKTRRRCNASCVVAGGVKP